MAGVTVEDDLAGYLTSPGRAAFCVLILVLWSPMRRTACVRAAEAPRKLAVRHEWHDVALAMDTDGSSQGYRSLAMRARSRGLYLRLLLRLRPPQKTTQFMTHAT